MYLRHPSLNEDLHCYWEGVIISLTPSNVVCECPRSPSISVVSPLRWRQDHFVPLESCMRIPAMSSFDKNHLAIERESKMIFLCLQSLVCAYLEFLAHIYIIPPLRERHSFMQQSEYASNLRCHVPCYRESVALSQTATHASNHLFSPTYHLTIEIPSLLRETVETFTQTSTS